MEELRGRQVGFEDWWKTTQISKTNYVPVMILAFKELAEKAWNAACENTRADQPVVVDERLPETMDDVLAFNGSWHFGYYEPSFGWRIYGIGEENKAAFPITHWKPMPPAPQK